MLFAMDCGVRSESGRVQGQWHISYGTLFAAQGADRCAVRVSWGPQEGVQVLRHPFCSNCSKQYGVSYQTPVLVQFRPAKPLRLLTGCCRRSRLACLARPAR